MLQSTHLDPDDPTGSYMLQAGARFCKCLGSEFLPYLPMVMPQLIQSASLSPDVTVREQDDDGEDIQEEDEDDEEVRAASRLCNALPIMYFLRAGIRT